MAVTHRLPRRPLQPRVIWGPESRRQRREVYDMVGPIGRARIDAVRKWREAYHAAEAPARAASTRRRLTAAFWAGWNNYWSKTKGRWKRYFNERPGFCGPLWIGGKR